LLIASTWSITGSVDSAGEFPAIGVEPSDLCHFRHSRTNV
jgi:hypothetical protein